MKAPILGTRPKVCFFAESFFAVLSKALQRHQRELLPKIFLELCPVLVFSRNRQVRRAILRRNLSPELFEATLWELAGVVEEMALPRLL